VGKAAKGEMQSILSNGEQLDELIRLSAQLDGILRDEGYSTDVESVALQALPQDAMRR